MPWSYRYHAQPDALVAHASGVLTDQDYTEGVKAVRADTRAIAAGRRFSDYSRVNRFEVTDKSLKALQRPKPLSGKHAFFIFNPAGESVFEQHLRLILAGNVRLFFSRKEALNWLNEGLPPDQRLAVEETLPPDYTNPPMELTGLGQSSVAG